MKFQKILELQFFTASCKAFSLYVLLYRPNILQNFLKFYKILQKFYKIHKKTPAPEPLFDETPSRPYNFIKKLPPAMGNFWRKSFSQNNSGRLLPTFWKSYFSQHFKADIPIGNNNTFTTTLCKNFFYRNFQLETLLITPLFIQNLSVILPIFY